MSDYASFGNIEIRHFGGSLDMRSKKRITGQRTALAVETRKGVFALLESLKLLRLGLRDLFLAFCSTRAPRALSSFLQL
jgi:hypothetical protein